MELRSRNMIFWDSSPTSLCCDYSAHYCHLWPGIKWYSSTEHCVESELQTDQPITVYGHMESYTPYQFGQHTAILAVICFPNTVGENLPVLWTNLECMCRYALSTMSMECTSLHIYIRPCVNAYSFYICLCLKICLSETLRTLSVSSNDNMTFKITKVMPFFSQGYARRGAPSWLSLQVDKNVCPGFDWDS